MNIVEDYRNTENKLDFFQSKLLIEQVEIIKKLNHEELAELIEGLSFGNIIRILREVDNEKKKEILSVVPKETLKAIYRASSTEEQQELIGLMEQQQAVYLKNIGDLNQSILNSSENITNNYQNIGISQMNIDNAKKNQKDAQSRLKDIEKNKMRIDRLRKKLEKKADKLAAKSYVGLFKKRKLRKLQNFQSKLREVNANLDRLNKETQHLTSDIAEYKNIMLQEKENIRKAKEEIEKSKKDLKEASKQVKIERAASVKLDKKAKSVFGKKIFMKNVHLRGHYLTTMKQEEIKKLKEAMEKRAEEELKNKQQEENQQTQVESKQQENQKVEMIEGEIVEKTDTENKQNNISREFVQRLMEFFQKLQEMEVIPQSNRIPVNSNNDRALLEKPTTTITQNELVAIMMVGAQMYVKGYVDAQKKQQEMEQEARTRGNVRTLSKGLVNITTLILAISIIAIIFGILLILKL